MSTQVDFGREYLDVIKRDGIECRSQEMIHDLWLVKSQKRGRSLRSPKKYIEVKCQFWLSISKRTKNIFCTKQNWFLEGSSIYL